MKTIYATEDYAFNLHTETTNGQSRACIVRHAIRETEEDTVLFDYSWPAQLTVEVEASEGSLREDGILRWELHVTAHHVSGMAQGEFTETEFFEVECPFGRPEEMV